MCGGDGIVVWVFDVIEKWNFEFFLFVVIFLLGIGNDLFRVL